MPDKVWQEHVYSRRRLHGLPGADIRVVLFKFGEHLQPGGILNIALWSDDIEATARELNAKGVEFGMEPTRQPSRRRVYDAPG